MAFNRGEIYMIYFDNDPSHKVYVGQTIQGTLTRIKQHIDDARTKGGGCPKLDEATRQFGVRHMHYKVLERNIATHEELDEAERFWIAHYDSVKNGYNVKTGGQRSDPEKKRVFKPGSSNFTETIAPMPAWARDRIFSFFGVPKELRVLLRLSR